MFIRNRNEPYLPLPSQPQLVLIYRPRGGRLSRPWCEVGQAEIRTRNLPIANPALYHTATNAPVVGRWTCDQQVAGSIPGRPAFGCRVGQGVHTHVPLSTSSSNLVSAFGARWEGNCRSDVALAMRHRHRGLSTYGLTTLEGR